MQYPVETLFCGHSGVVSDGRSALEKKLRFLEWLQEESCRLADRGLSPREISRRLLAGGKMMEWVTLGEFSLGSSDSLDCGGEGMIGSPFYFSPLFNSRSISCRIVTSGTVSS